MKSNVRKARHWLNNDDIITTHRSMVEDNDDLK